MPDNWLSTGAAATILGVDRRTVSLWIKDGRMPATETAGGQYRIARAVVENFRVDAAPTPKAVGALVLAVAHHAGGVGKTTTTSNLAYALASTGQRVCVVDLDPQGDLSERLGVTPLAPTLATALTTPGHGAPAVARCAWGGVGFDLVPSSLGAMAGVELALGSMINGREQRLRRAVAPLRAAYDFILIDCPPNLSLLMVNALYAADGVIIPVQAQDKAYRQLDKVFSTIDEVNEYRDPDNPLAIFGLVVTMVDKRAAMAGEVEAALRSSYGDLVFAATVPLRTDAATDSRFQAPIGVYAAQNAAARAHAALAEEVLSRAH